ncbi:MAG: hypothetical protein ACYDEI_02735 [Erysipelotrichaceae bacterium]
MKYKYFVQLYGSYGLIIISVFLLSSDLVYIPFVGLYYYFLLKEYNRVGFINTKIQVLLVLFSFSLFIIFGFRSYILYFEIVLTLIVLQIHIPHRKKVCTILKLINYNLPLKVFNNRIEVEYTIFNFDFDLKEREVLWLSKKILIKSKYLSCMDIEFINNEFLGSHFCVNIS